MNDKLAKLGYRLRPRVVKPGIKQQPGDVGFDELGNAVYQWRDKLLRADDSTEAERLRLQALDHPGLAIVDDEPSAIAGIQPNPKGLRMGYNPYQSGILQKNAWKPKRNLRELSRWIETKRKLKQRADD